MSTVLVTGAAGFVGSAVVRRLVADGARLWDGSEVSHVAAAVRPGASLERLEPLAESPGWSVEVVDLDDRTSVEQAISRHQPRAIVHTELEASVYEGASPGHGRLEALMACLGGLGDARFLHTGSAWVLAPGTRLAEDAPTAARTAYARHKLEQDRLVPRLAGAHDVCWINLRLFNLFGRYERPSRLVPTLVERLSRAMPANLSHGAQVRDFSDVDEIARAFLLALAAPDRAWDALYHIGSGRATSAHELAQMVAAVTGSEDLIRLGGHSTQDEGVPALTADPSLASRELGWAVESPLEESVRSAVEWWLARLAAPEARQLVEEPIR